MERKTTERLLAVASALLFLAALVFLIVCLFGGGARTTWLGCALGCSLLANLFNLIRVNGNKKR
ncbi:MAG: hypothetical protein Q4C53_07940 [Clostridia bacterium]|nr:hypothetical protein [Clostridia bacterium]